MTDDPPAIVARYVPTKEEWRAISALSDDPVSECKGAMLAGLRAHLDELPSCPAFAFGPSLPPEATEEQCLQEMAWSDFFSDLYQSAHQRLVEITAL